MEEKVYIEIKRSSVETKTDARTAPLVTIPRADPIHDPETGKDPAAFSISELLLVLFSAEKRAALSSSEQEHTTVSAATMAVLHKASLAIYAVFGIFFALNLLVLTTAASDVRQICDDQDLATFVIAAAGASILSLLWLLVLNYHKSPSTGMHSVFAILVLGSVAMQIVSQISLAANLYHCDATGPWNAYHGVNWVLVSALLIECFVCRVPWSSFFRESLIPSLQAYAHWTDMETRAELLKNAFRSDDSCVVVQGISSKAVRGLIKTVVFVYACLYSVFIFGLIRSAVEFGPDSRQMMPGCSQYGFLLLLAALGTAVYLPLPFVAARGFSRVKQVAMVLLLGAVVVLTVLGEGRGDELAAELSGNTLYYTSVMRACSSAISFRWYLHLSWFLLVPLAFDSLLMNATKWGKHATSKDHENENQRLLTVSS